jgi:hypothetical protein
MILKPPSLAEDFDYIYSQDPALDYQRGGFEDAFRLYRERGDVKHIEPFIRSGETPARWSLQHIRGRARLVLQHVIAGLAGGGEGGTTGLVLFEVCQLGLDSVTGLVDDTGKPLAIEHFWDEKHRVRRVTEEVMTRLTFIDKGGLVSELGAVAFEGVSLPGK